ncbi:hypothetical protein UY3_13639 [Chelonia mydas]|uniref:Uncharacterized protein n=1 Tax=Chelonia mydas TaxID=8469 RepID=M7BM20_CHEMY|nr:hypothetical protein UY3_13639 [Chelonia mydas]
MQNPRKLPSNNTAKPWSSFNSNSRITSLLVGRELGIHDSVHPDASKERVSRPHHRAAGEALGKEEPDREEGLWQPGLPAAEYPEDLEGPGCSPGRRESDTDRELELPSAEYPDDLEGPERPAGETREEVAQGQNGTVGWVFLVPGPGARPPPPPATDRALRWNAVELRGPEFPYPGQPVLGSRTVRYKPIPALPCLRGALQTRAGAPLPEGRAADSCRHTFPANSPAPERCD